MQAAYYTWFSENLKTEFESLKLLKQSERGTVRLICHRESGQKFVLRRFSGNAEVYRKLLDCVCPQLPTVYEVASLDGQNLVLEEYIHGDNMGVMLKDALFTSDETRHIVKDLCKGLWVLHGLGAVHRDIKPENIILRDKSAILIDFDAARVYKEEMGGDTQVLGTTGFAAPEQYGLSQSDARSDIYSLGILINVMRTGEHPSRHLVEGRFGRIVTRCTQVNPSKRYQTVLRLLEEL